MIYFPPCKINLGLQILKKRNDGFHEIESAMLEIPFYDALEVVEADSLSFRSSGLEIPGRGNLCTDAFQLLQQDFAIPPVAIHLHKVIPMGGGLGGGSSDGAKTLVALRDLFHLEITKAKLREYAAELGSDCPFFIDGGLQLATGRGELLEKLSLRLPAIHIVLVNAGIHVPTKDAYAHVVPNPDQKPLTELLNAGLEFWKGHLVNDFEQSVFQQHPVLADVKADLYKAGASYAAMSGSGSTLFGLFTEKPAAISWSKQPVFERWTFITN